MQLSYSQNPAIGRPGMIADTAIVKHTKSRIANNYLRAGYAVFRVPGYGSAGTPNTEDPGQVYNIVVGGIAADADAIATAMTSATGTFTTQDGVMANLDLMPARKLSVTFDASTDWDPTNGTIVYINDEGKQVSETIAIATSTAPTTVGYARRFVSFTKPAQTGAGGAATIGIAVLDTLTTADIDGVAQYVAGREPALTTPDSLAAEFKDGDAVPVLEVGQIVVVTEEACTPDSSVYVRIAPSGANTQLGAFRATVDSSTAVDMSAKWKYLRTSAIGGLNVVSLR